MEKTVYVSLVSHDSENLIIENFSHFKNILDRYTITVSVMDNTGSKKLESFCKDKGFLYYHDGKIRGYGHNHNKNFEHLNPKDEDLFLVCNPDIYISLEHLKNALDSMVKSGADIFNIKSYLDYESKKTDYPDRYYPGLLNFFISFLSGKRLHYGKNEDVKHPEWMSGAFMLFKVSSYRKLGGFDEDYFMYYCEDIDICYRAKKMGMTLFYDNRYYNLHNSKMSSRKALSKNMFWHISSAFKFVYKNRFYKLLTLSKKSGVC